MVELFDVVANGKQIHMVTLNFGGMLASKTTDAIITFVLLSSLSRINPIT